MFLDTVDRKLVVRLADPITTNELPVVVNFASMSAAASAFVPGSQLSSADGAGDLDILDAPGASIQKQCKYINIRNSDTVQHDIAVIYDDDGAEYLLWEGPIIAGDTLTWTPEFGWVPGGVPGPQGNTGPTGPTGPQGDSFVWEGLWDIGTEYQPMDAVFFNGQAYICLQTHTNQPPDTNPDDWDLMVQRGATGATGATGPTGSTGPTGPTGASGIGVVWQGTWDVSTAYVADDAVYYQGTAYVALGSTTGDVPSTSPSDWDILFQTAPIVEIVSGTSLAIALADRNKTFVLTNSGTITVTIDNLLPGDEIGFIVTDPDAVVDFEGDTGTTVNTFSTGTVSMVAAAYDGQQRMAYLVCTATDEYSVGGYVGDAG
jgi:hypothetical protein